MVITLAIATQLVILRVAVLVMPLVMGTAVFVILQSINLTVLVINMTVVLNGEAALLTIATMILVWVQLSQLNAVR